MADKLAVALEKRGLRVWLDQKQILPGDHFVEKLEDILLKVRTAAVLVGSAGFGPWHRQEMRAGLDQLVSRNMRVIPILLRGAPRKENWPLFLSGLTQLDLRNGFDDAALDNLVKAVQGTRSIISGG